MNKLRFKINFLNETVYCDKNEYVKKSFKTSFSSSKKTQKEGVQKNRVNLVNIENIENYFFLIRS